MITWWGPLPVYVPGKTAEVVVVAIVQLVVVYAQFIVYIGLIIGTPISIIDSFAGHYYHHSAWYLLCEYMNWPSNHWTGYWRDECMTQFSWHGCRDYN